MNTNALTCFPYRLALPNSGNATVRVEQKVNGVYQYLTTQQTQTTSGLYEIFLPMTACYAYCQSSLPFGSSPNQENIRISVSGTSGFALNNLSLDRDNVDTLVNRYLVSRGYRYGFQGQEKDDEVKGEGNSYVTHFRLLDPRLGRWLSIGPRKEKYPDVSPYVAFANNPILFSDSDGDSIRLAGTKQEKWRALAYLQTLTNDKLTKKNGTVLIETVGRVNPNKELPSGTALIDELIGQNKNVVIFQNSNSSKNADVYKNPNSFDVIDYENKSNGVGLDAIVRIDFTKENETTLLIEDLKTHKSVWKKVARESSLAHELIHAYAIINGTQAKEGEKVNYRYRNSEGVTIEVQGQDKEGTETVGLTGNRKYTENKIRKEQGWGKRVKY